MVGALAQLLARLVAALGGSLTAGDVGGPAEAAALATMALEVATALTNPAIALNPAMPAPQRTREECPLVEEVGFFEAEPMPTLCIYSTFPCAAFHSASVWQHMWRTFHCTSLACILRKCHQLLLIMLAAAHDQQHAQAAGAMAE